MKKCPICSKEYSAPSALSRTDNKTKICPRCGLIEAMRAAGIKESVQEEILKEEQKQSF